MPRDLYTLIKPSFEGASEHVYTYFEQTVINRQEEQDCLDEWRKSWTDNGWTPVVLGRTDAAKSHLYQAMLDKAKALPTTNPKDYEVACFLRWCALHAVNGGLMVDYDVMNYGLVPGAYNTQGDLTLLAWDNPCPCAVSGCRNEIGRWIELMIKYQPVKDELRHCSDQSICQAMAGHFVRLPLVGEYKSDSWQKAQLVHFNRGSTHKHGGKVPVMQKVVLEKMQSAK